MLDTASAWQKTDFGFEYRMWGRTLEIISLVGSHESNSLRWGEYLS